MTTHARRSRPPLFSRHLSLQVLGSATLYWPETFLFCRHTDDHTTGRFSPYVLNVTALPPDDQVRGRNTARFAGPAFAPSHRYSSIGEYFRSRS